MPGLATTTLPARLLQRSWWLGLALTGALAAAAFGAARLPWAQHYGLGALTLAVALGALIGNTLFPAIAADTAAGVDFAKSTLLRAGVVLYGFRVTFQQIAGIGWSGLLIDVLVIALTLLLALQLGTRVLKLDRRTALLIGAGSAICGATAVLATAPILRSRDHEVSVAVASVVLFGTLAMFAYPLLYPLLGLSEYAYGVYAGATIHEVAQVVVAGNGVGETAAATAVIVKMLRVMMLAPVLLLLGFALRQRRTGDVTARFAPPWFALWFIAASALNSQQWLPTALVELLRQLDTLLLAAAMAALGLHTRLDAIRRAGFRPMLLAGVLFVFLCGGGYGLTRLVLGWPH